MSHKDKSMEDIERSSEEIMEEAMREIAEDLHDPEEPEADAGMPEKHGDVIRLDDTEEDVYDDEDEDGYMDGDEPDDGEEDGAKKKGHRKALIAVLVILGVLVLSYTGTALFFTTHFLPYTKINGTDFSGKTAGAVEAFMEEQVKGYELTLQ